MVDKYYRKIDNVENEIENSIQISGILLNLKGYDEKMSDLSKIGNNQKSINNNKNDITNNQKSINNNKNDINNNKNDIDNNKNNITNNQKSINNNKNDINNNKNDIDNNKNNITNNQKSINNNKNDINNNKNNINNNSVDITKLSSYYKLGKIYIYDIQKGNKFVDKNNYYHIFEKEIIYNFIKDSNNIDKLKIKNNRNDLDIINITDSEIANYNAEDNLEELNILSMHEDYDSSIMTIQNSRLIVKISECDIFSGGNEIDKIPEIFFKKRNLLIMKNDDNKCFLYCYIRKFKNIITNKTSRITKKDLLIAEEIIDECNMDFENVSLD